MASIERYGGTAMTAGIWVLVGIIGFFLLTEHQAHVFGILPWLFLLACPAMHLLMHRRHHHPDGASRHTADRSGHHNHPLHDSADSAPVTTGHGGVS